MALMLESAVLMRFSSLVFTTLVICACSKKSDPLAELDAHADKVCAATDYKSARVAWKETLKFLDAHDDKSLVEPARQITTAIIDHAAVKQATGTAAKLLECAEKHGAL
jgi:hypothetical protein